MQVLVIGGTGTLGRQIAKNAIDAGYKVRCMVRKPKAASFLQEWGCELTRGNLLNKADIELYDRLLRAGVVQTQLQAGELKRLKF